MRLTIVFVFSCSFAYRYDALRSCFFFILYRLFGSNRIRIAKNKTRIIGVSSTDNGVYSCRASNAGGSANSVENFLLSVPGSVTASSSTVYSSLLKRPLAAYTTQMKRNNSSLWKTLVLRNFTKKHNSLST